jgi:hypothetical protein
MNISDEVVLFITSISKNYYKKKEFSLDNSNIKIFRTNDTFIEINLYEFISRCKKYLLEQGYGISIVEDKTNIRLSLFKGGLIVQDFSFSNSYEQGIADCLEWHLHNLKDIKKGA